jgi:acyl-CoA synthetase (AMP-forming)/AMP-acid ligase II
MMCRNGRNFAAAVFAAALVGADIVLVNTEFSTNALAGALSAYQISTVFCDNEFAEWIRAAGEFFGAIDPATAPTQLGESRPKVVASGRLVLLTSGTTSVLKGLPCTPRMSSGMGAGMTTVVRAGLGIGSRIAVAVPMFHGLGSAC